MVLQFPSLKTVLIIFVLVIGCASPPVEPAVVSVSAIASAAANAVTAGGSLAGTTLQGIADTWSGVTCAIQVENWTHYPLLYPTARLKAGVLNVAPVAILPGKREAFAVRKTSGTFTGTYGTVSWEVFGTRRRFVLMWSAPYFNHYSNWMGLGVTTPWFTSVARGNTWFDQMYYGSNNCNLKFERGEFYYVTDPVIYRDNEFEIVGVMTSIHRAQIKVVFRPIRSKWHNLAPLIRAIVEHSNATRRN